MTPVNLESSFTNGRGAVLAKDPQANEHRTERKCGAHKNTTAFRTYWGSPYCQLNLERTIEKEDDINWFDLRLFTCIMHFQIIVKSRKSQLIIDE